MLTGHHRFWRWILALQRHHLLNVRPCENLLMHHVLNLHTMLRVGLQKNLYVFSSINLGMKNAVNFTLRCWTFVGGAWCRELGDVFLSKSQTLHVFLWGGLGERNHFKAISTHPKDMSQIWKSSPIFGVISGQRYLRCHHLADLALKEWATERDFAYILLLILAYMTQT